MTGQSEIYNNVYMLSGGEYNYQSPLKNLLVDHFALTIGGRLLDVGCGMGVNLRRLHANGHDVLGIEISEVCCERFLRDLPHANDSVLSFSAKNKERYSGVICMDMLEHIASDCLAENLAAISDLAPIGLFGIANHSDVHCGIELHLIQQDAQWWRGRLREHFARVVPVVSLYEDRFFAFLCSNADLSIGAIDYTVIVEDALIALEGARRSAAAVTAIKNQKGQFSELGIIISEPASETAALRAEIKRLLNRCAEIDMCRAEMEVSINELRETNQGISDKLATLAAENRSLVGRHDALLGSLPVRLYNSVARFIGMSSMRGDK